MIGPPVQPPPNPSNLNMTLQPIWQIFSSPSSSSPLPPKIGLATYIDIRDVSDLHIWCAENPSVSNGQRYLITNGRAPPQAIADLLRESFPERRNKIPGAEKSGEGYEVDYSFPKDSLVLISDKAKGALGRNFVGFERSVLDTVEVFEKVYGQYLWITIVSSGMVVCEGQSK